MLAQQQTAIKSQTKAPSVADLLHFSSLATNTQSLSANKVLKFPSEKVIKHKRWICNISEHFRFVKHKEQYLHIMPNQNNSQFRLLCKLLALASCDIIYFDANFTQDQLKTIRALQNQSKTELVNSKQAFLLSLKQYAF